MTEGKWSIFKLLVNRKQHKDQKVSKGFVLQNDDDEY